MTTSVNKANSKPLAFKDGRRFQWTLTAVGLLALSGCHCCSLFEPYADLIDAVGEQVPILEPFYVPQLDPSRMGTPDWCSSPLNRFLFPCRCQNVYTEYAVLSHTEAIAQPPQWKQIEEESSTQMQPAQPHPLKPVSSAQSSADTQIRNRSQPRVQPLTSASKRSQPLTLVQHQAEQAPAQRRHQPRIQSGLQAQTQASFQTLQPLHPLQQPPQSTKARWWLLPKILSRRTATGETVGLLSDK